MWHSVLTPTFNQCFLIVAFIFFIKWLLRKKCSLPGPWGVPLFGYIPFLGKRPYLTFTELAKTYGPIYQLTAGMQTIVVISDAELIAEAYGKDLAFAGRPNIPSLRTFVNSGKSRFAFKPANSSWRFLRKTSLKALSMFASSRNSKLENVAKEGLDTFINQVDQNLEKPWDFQRALFDMMSGIVGSIMFGFDFDPKHPVLASVLGIQERIGMFVTPGSLMDSIPFGEYIFYRKKQSFLEDVHRINVVSEEHIARHVYDGQDGDVRDVEDALTKTATETSQAEKEEIGVTDLNIRFISQDLFAAGFGTTTDSFVWLLNLTAYHRQVQSKVHEEIDRVLGSREPELNDRTSLPYVEAVMYEAFRFASLVPLGLPHATQEGIGNFHGFFIPKGCTVFANFWALHHDPKRFPEPDRFKPERFVREDGAVDVDLGTKVLAFSTGKRRCVGENLARQELSLLYTSVMQRFSVAIDPAEKINDISDASVGFTRSPPKYRLVFKQRAS